jgi:hypothetical protein
MDKIINSAIDIALKNKKPLDLQGVMCFKADRTVEPNLILTNQYVLKSSKSNLN